MSESTSPVANEGGLLYTIRNVSEALNFSPQTVWRWCRDGKLGYLRIGKSIRIPESEIARLVTKCTVVSSEAIVQEIQQDIVNQEG
jgi:excisionase family DNA binding protein